MDRLALPTWMLLPRLGSSAPQAVARPQWQRHLEAHGLRGAFVLHHAAGDRFQVLDEARARSRYLPAATFEVVVALLGLELGVVADDSERFAWDGKPRPRPACEGDQTLATALRNDVAWTFQEIARRIGKAEMREWLARLGYGNRDLAGGIDLFWLQGGLRVSAQEQARFLRRLAEGRLPMSQRSQRMVREALRVERTRGHALYAKSGTACGREGAAWWVGWVERRGRAEAFFALNATPIARDAPTDRVAATRAILHDAGVMPL